MPDHFSAECQPGPWEAGQGLDLSPAFVEWKFSPFQGTVLRSTFLLSSPWGLGSSLSQSWGAHRRPLGQAWVPRGAACHTVAWFTGWLLCGTHSGECWAENRTGSDGGSSLPGCLSPASLSILDPVWRTVSFPAELGILFIYWLIEVFFGEGGFEELHPVVLRVHSGRTLWTIWDAWD